MMSNVFLYFLFIFFLYSLCRGGYTYVTVFNCPPIGSHILSSERLCMPARSVCFRTPRLSLGHPGSFKSAHDLKCMRTQTAPLFNVPRGRREEQMTAWTRFELITTFWLWARSLIHFATCASGGIRTLNLSIKSPVRYPLRQRSPTPL